MVGVHLRRAEHDETAHTIDYAVSGTAVRWRPAGESRWPQLTDLSVQAYWKLLDAGCEAVGLLSHSVKEREIAL